MTERPKLEGEIKEITSRLQQTQNSLDEANRKAAAAATALSAAEGANRTLQERELSIHYFLSLSDIHMPSFQSAVV